MYMSYQPCHHSGGRVSEDPDAQLAVAFKRANQAHPTSCSERLKAFYEAEMRDHHISLELVVADLYKVMWTEELMIEAGDGVAKRTVYTNDAASGQEGMRLLLSTPGVILRSMGDSDWAFLISLCGFWRCQTPLPVSPCISFTDPSTCPSTCPSASPPAAAKLLTLQTALHLTEGIRAHSTLNVAGTHGTPVMQVRPECARCIWASGSAGFVIHARARGIEGQARCVRRRLHPQTDSASFVKPYDQHKIPVHCSVNVWIYGWRSPRHFTQLLTRCDLVFPQTC